MIKELLSIERFSDDKEKRVKEKLKKWQEDFDTTKHRLRQLEYQAQIIVKTVLPQQGQWYKCKCGHPYVIGNCGQPAASSRCPDCKDQVGYGSGNSNFNIEQLNINSSISNPRYM